MRAKAWFALAPLAMVFAAASSAVPFEGATLTPLGLPYYSDGCTVFSISDDGSAIYGACGFPGSTSGFRWSETTGYEFIPYEEARATRPCQDCRIRFNLPDEFDPNDVSDGDVVVGWYDGFPFSGSRVAARWSEQGGLEFLDDPVAFYSAARGTSSDGSITVGDAALIGSDKDGPAIWDESGVHFLTDLLEASGFDSTDWLGLGIAYAVSSDGRTIAGSGIRWSVGYEEAWIATLLVPEPSTALLGVVGLAGLGALKVRSRTTTFSPISGPTPRRAPARPEAELG